MTLLTEGEGEGTSSVTLWIEFVRRCEKFTSDMMSLELSARFLKFAFLLFCYVTNHFMTVPLGNSEGDHPRRPLKENPFDSRQISRS